MPIQTRFVPPEVFLRYRGVSIRRTYFDDDYDSPDLYFFAIVSKMSPAIEHQFDVRDLPGYCGQEPNRLLADLFRELVASGVLTAEGITYSDRIKDL